MQAHYNNKVLACANIWIQGLFYVLGFVHVMSKFFKGKSIMWFIETLSLEVKGLNLYFKNVFRAILKNKGSYFGAISIIALGILVFVAMSDVMTNLKKSTYDYYNTYHFADVFAQVNAIPSQKLKALEEIEGIEVSDGRLGQDVRLVLDGSDNIINLHLMGYKQPNSVNAFMVSTDLSELNENSILLGNKMLDVYGFDVGDEINLMINSQLQSFTIAGTVQAPDYVYAVPPSGAQLPDDEIYDIAVIRSDKLQKLLGKGDVASELGFILKAGYKYEDLKAKLETSLKTYGLISLVKRQDQLSNYMLQSEFMQLASLSTVLPAIFLTVSVFMLYIILKRMVDQDRTLIGTLKAFGFRDFEIVKTYMKQGILTGILGSILGSALSYPLGFYLFKVYAKFYNLPSYHYKMNLKNILIGVVLSVVTSIIATYFGIKDVLKINPAEAMRSEAPVLHIKLKLPMFLNKVLNSKKKMAIRSIFRNKLRSAMIAFAILFPFGLVAVLSSFPSVMQQMFYDQFTKIQTYDLKVSLDNYVSYNDAIASVEAVDGIYNIEGLAEYSIHIKNKNRSEYSKLVALKPHSSICKIMDNKGRYYEPRAQGLIVNSVIAKKLNIKAGDIVEITNVYLSCQEVKIPVLQVIDESFGSGIYMDIDAVHKYFNVSAQANAIIFNVEKGKLNQVKKFLIDTRNITSVTDKARTLNNYKTSMQSMLIMVRIFEFLSILAGVILIYNISNITMRERKNEFGTMTILGMRFNEIVEMVAFEQWINFVVGILLGVPFSFFIRNLVEKMIASDAYTIDLFVAPSGYVYGFFVCLAIMVLSLSGILKNIRAIEMTDVLKERQ